MGKSLAALPWFLKQPAGGLELATHWLRDLKLVVCRKALTGGPDGEAVNLALWEEPTTGLRAA